MSPEPEKRSDEETWARLAAAATEGPWTTLGERADGAFPVVAERGRVWIAPVGSGRSADAQFIAASRTAVPALLAALAASRADNERLRAKVDRVEALCEHTEAWIGSYAHIDSIRDAIAEHDLDILADSQRGTYESDGAYERLRESFAAARGEVSQLRAKIERVEAHDEWATREREHFRNQMFVERDRTERVEAIIGAALAWLDDADPLPERNGNIFAELRAVLAEPLGSTEDPPATEENQ